MKFKTFVLFVLVVLLNISTAQAVINPIINGDFETGTNLGWSFTGPYSSEYGVTSSAWGKTSYEGTYFARSFGRGDVGGSCSITQSIDCTELNAITFWMQQYTYWNDKPQHTFTASVGSESITLEKGQATIWKQYTINVEGLTGYQTFGVYASTTGSSSSDQIYLIMDLVEGIEAPSYITWTTYPPDSWARGNYSMIGVRVPASANDFTFWYKTPSTEYTEMPIPKNYLFAFPSYDYTDDLWYYNYWKTCYHAVHGNYSAKLVINGYDSSVTNRYIPYLDLDVDMPDIITIPVPDVYVDPPHLNVTVPPKYDNVTWLINYSEFWDGIGDSINITQYTTVGLLLIPLESFNTSIYYIYKYVDDASGMLMGFEHCALIVRSGWGVIPPEIQTIFIGAASLGIIIFIFHRRT